MLKAIYTLSSLKEFTSIIVNELNQQDVISLLVFILSKKDLQGELSCSSLNKKEIERANAFKNIESKNLFILRRRILKDILKSITGTDEVFLLRNGKPISADPNIHFSHSNKNRCLLYSFSKKCPLGVDLEIDDSSLSFDAIASTFFTVEEKKEYEKSKPNENRYLYRNWTLKEALAKCSQEKLYSLFGLTIPNRHLYPHIVMIKDTNYYLYFCRRNIYYIALATNKLIKKTKTYSLTFNKEEYL